MKAIESALLLAVLAAPAWAGDIPPCALSGSPTVMIAGRPALRLADVARCPAALIEPIAGIMIDGQPMVHVRSGAVDETACAARGEASVSADGRPAQGLGDVSCSVAP